MIKIENLKKQYIMGEVIVNALKGVTLEIEKGDIISLMGKSGSGKSTLLHQIGLLDYPTSGVIEIDSQDVISLSSKQRSALRLATLGYVFQEYAILPGLTALENVLLPSMMLGTRMKEAKDRGKELLDKVGIGKRANHLPKELSGGEQQRVAIARALINQPTYLFADEATANLDTVTSKKIMETLVEMNHELGVTVLFVSHDPDDKQFARNHVYLKDGEIVEAYF